MSPLRGALLGLIARGPRSGYELAKIFDLTLANVWSAKHSQIYPELLSMERDGLVAVTETGSRGRKTYSITRAGRKALRSWLVDSPPVRGIARNEALLRSFFLGFLTRNEAVALLEAERRRHVEQLAVYEEDAASGRVDAPGGWTGGIALEAGIRFERAMIGWADWAIDEVAKFTSDAAEAALAAG